MSEQPSDAQQLLAEVQALRRSVSNLERLAGSQADQQAQAGRVVVTNVSIGFWAMVYLFVTAAFAAIPALLIIGVVGALLGLVLMMVMGRARWPARLGGWRAQGHAPTRSPAIPRLAAWSARL